MSEPTLPLIELKHDFARQSTMTASFAAVNQALAAIAAQLTTLTDKVNILMTEDATVAAAAAQIEADQAATKTALESVQALLVTLQGEVSSGSAQLSPATLAALAQAQTDMDALAAEAAADASSDAPPSASPS
jgi:septal ring factor EnvC (AmiA/AmiB activator)